MESTSFGPIIEETEEKTKEKTLCPDAADGGDCQASIQNPWDDLYTSIKRGHLPCLKKIWQEKDYKNAEDGINHCLNGQIMPLVYAGSVGTAEIVQYLVEDLKADVNKLIPFCIEHRQNSPLSAAAYDGNYRICEILIKNGADLSKVRLECKRIVASSIQLYMRVFGLSFEMSIPCNVHTTRDLN